MCQAQSSLPIVREIKPSGTCCVGIYLTYPSANSGRSEEHTSELQSQAYLVCRLLLEKKKKKTKKIKKKKKKKNNKVKKRILILLNKDSTEKTKDGISHGENSGDLVDNWRRNRQRDGKQMDKRT